MQVSLLEAADSTERERRLDFESEVSIRPRVSLKNLNGDASVRFQRHDGMVGAG